MQSLFVMVKEVESNFSGDRPPFFDDCHSLHILFVLTNRIISRLCKKPLYEVLTKIVLPIKKPYNPQDLMSREVTNSQMLGRQIGKKPQVKSMTHCLGNTFLLFL